MPRLLFAVLSFAVCTATAAFSMSRYWPFRPSSVALALALLLLAHFSLAFAKTPDAPWRPLRLSLSIAVLAMVYMLAGLPLRPRGPEVLAFAFLALGIALTLAVVGLINRAPRFSLLILLLLAFMGIYSGAELLKSTLFASERADFWPASPSLSITLAAGVWASWVVALWHGRRLLKSVTAAT